MQKLVYKSFCPSVECGDKIILVILRSESGTICLFKLLSNSYYACDNTYYVNSYYACLNSYCACDSSYYASENSYYAVFKTLLILIQAWKAL